jgi:predicted nucleic acid-binding protein
MFFKKLINQSALKHDIVRKTISKKLINYMSDHVFKEITAELDREFLRKLRDVK